MIEFVSEKLLPKFFLTLTDNVLGICQLMIASFRSSAIARKLVQRFISRVRPTSSAVVENLRTSVLPLCLHRVANRIPSAPAAAATSR
jgi:hypothetical protein